MGKPEKKKAKRIKEESEEDDDDDFKGKEDDDDDDDDEDDERDHGKKDDKDVVKKNAQGEAYFELAKTRRVTVRSFKGAKLIDIREVRLKFQDFILQRNGKKILMQSIFVAFFKSFMIKTVRWNLVKKVLAFHWISIKRLKKL